MRRLGSALVLLVLAVTATASSGADVDWRKLPYFDYDVQQLFVSTDAKWNGARVVLGARTHKPFPSNVLFGRTVPRNYIWARTCSNRSQAVTFTRTIHAPGAPGEGTVSFVLGFGFVGKAFTSGALYVNGIQVTGALSKGIGPRSYSGPLSARARAAFRYGPNTLTIRAVKAPTKRGEACQHRHRTLGVVADLHLRFTSDVEAVPLVNGRERTVPAAGFSGAEYAMRIRNNGPSGSVAGIFELTASVSANMNAGVSDFSAAAIGAPFHDCKVEPLAGLRGGRITCSYAALRAGTTAVPIVRIPAQTVPGFGPTSVGELRVTWQVIPKGTDPKGNNVERHTTYLCGSTATDPKCAAA